MFFAGVVVFFIVVVVILVVLVLAWMGASQRRKPGSNSDVSYGDTGHQR